MRKKELGLEEARTKRNGIREMKYISAERCVAALEDNKKENLNNKKD